VKGQKFKLGKQRSMEVGNERSYKEKTAGGKQKGEGSGEVDAEVGDCEDIRSGWADRKGEG
jgi:hypothetical protein